MPASHGTPAIVPNHSSGTSSTNSTGERAMSRPDSVSVDGANSRPTGAGVPASACNRPSGT